MTACHDIPESAIVRSRPASVGDGRSDLEVALAFAIRTTGLPVPEREYRFMPCRQCGHGDFPAHVLPEPDLGKPFCLDCGRAGEAHRFVPARRWRCDFAWPEHRLAVEVQGGLFVQGRHNRGAALGAEYERHAEATLRGWRVLYVTAEQVEDGTALEWIERALAEPPQRP